MRNLTDTDMVSMVIRIPKTILLCSHISTTTSVIIIQILKPCRNF